MNSYIIDEASEGKKMDTQKSKLTLNAEIYNLIMAGEGFHLELKETFDKSFMEEVCAFANSGGGRIIIGVSDNGIIKGCNTDNRSRSLIQDSLRSLQPNLDISIDIIDSLIVVMVPEGSDKPYACSKGFYVRNGANSQKLDRNEIVEFFQKEGRIHFDELRNDKANFETDFDERALIEFLGMAGISKTIDMSTLLKNLGCLTDEGKLTNAGVLFFTKDIDFILNNAIIVCVLFKGTEKVHILDKKDFSGNILENINNAVAFVQRHTNLEYVIKTLRRENVPEIPEVALRETIINAVCHRDYFDKRANVLIEIFDDRVIISNPGGLPGGLKPQDFGKKSVARNQIIASLLHRVNFIEKVGTGISRIRQAVSENGKSSRLLQKSRVLDFYWSDMQYNCIRSSQLQKFDNKRVFLQLAPSVVFSYDDAFFTVTYTRNNETTQTLTDKQIEILQYLMKNPYASRQEMAKNIADITTDGIKYNLKRLQDIGVLKRIGTDFGGHWLVQNNND